MAAIAIPLLATGVQIVAPLIPTIVQAVEDLFGHSSQSGKQEGPAKLTTAVDVLQQLLTAFANAGKMPSAAVVDPSMPAALAGAVQQAVAAMKAQGLLNGTAQPTPVPVAAATAPAPLFTGSFTINGK